MWGATGPSSALPQLFDARMFVTRLWTDPGGSAVGRSSGVGGERGATDIVWRQLRWQPLVSGLANSLSLTPQALYPAVYCTV